MHGTDTVPTTPADIKFMRLQAAVRIVNGPYTARLDAFQQRRVLGAISSVFHPTAITTSNNWEVIRSITAGTPGDPVTVKCAFDARIRDATSSLVGTASIRVRIQRFTETHAGTEVNVMSQMLLGDPIGSNDDSGWARYEIDTVDDRGDAGTFIYEAQFTSDENQTAVEVRVRTRVISWNLAEQGD